jgi:methylated-DNA-[protein]-cysteine S-methyltransferase
MPHASTHLFHLIPSPFGDLVIVWKEEAQGPQIHHIFLPQNNQTTENRIRGFYDLITPGSCKPIEELALQIHAFLKGEPISFGLDILAMYTCSEFQQKVLLAEHAIPRGMVSTYARVSGHVGRPGAARAVGMALARNPFPILIPCHRVIRSDGTLGGFQGGLAMKRALLEMEGVVVSKQGKVIKPNLYY